MASYSFFFRHMLNTAGPETEVETPDLGDKLLCGNPEIAERPQADYITFVREILQNKPCDNSRIIETVRRVVGFNHESIEASSGRNARNGRCVIYVGPEEIIREKVIGADKLFIYVPFGMDSTYDKTLPEYDADTCTAYAANVLGENVCRRRVHEILRMVEDKSRIYEQVVLAGEGAGAWLALLAGAVSGKKTVLYGLNENFEKLFDKDVYFLPETNVLDGILCAGDVSDILNAADNVISVSGSNKEIFYAEINA